MAQASRNASISGVERIIEYTFSDGLILWEALHAPGANTYDIGNRNLSNGNKRLALLGDTVLKTVLIEGWYTTTAPRAARGSQIVADVGGNANLAGVGRQHGIEHFIVTHPGQFGPVAAGTIADTVEAILGAVWLDSTNLATVRAVMQTLGLA
ncbi:MAG: hypothetical protein Q9164_006320 [Protoblastenia rupestris]